ncbi:uncharacterized protein TRUGW13939_08816 [Talaromyces rugulosus]|uniref:Uncharacterized protein n=1 Tax=Talaromyces rugulosus TaxID=121627 RepID=A0A7H8R5J9_TALRU|nr:uncharacterized protein TRUGW13939_08816 [Talaromyces rugulosus]QKX61664.1 hypothetical protein TRUGW13939_08816 [Talaromyces rugulosus]
MDEELSNMTTAALIKKSFLIHRSFLSDAIPAIASGIGGAATGIAGEAASAVTAAPSELHEAASALQTVASDVKTAAENQIETIVNKTESVLAEDVQQAINKFIPANISVGTKEVCLGYVDGPGACHPLSTGANLIIAGLVFFILLTLIIACLIFFLPWLHIFTRLGLCITMVFSCVAIFLTLTVAVFTVRSLAGELSKHSHGLLSIQSGGLGGYCVGILICILLASAVGMFGLHKENDGAR